MAKLDNTSELRLVGVSPVLINILRNAIPLIPFPIMVVEGLRTRERQAELYAQGRTKPGKVVTWTLNSKHIDGKAVDLAPYIDGKIDWSDPKKFDAINKGMSLAAKRLGVKIRWGADWDQDGVPRERGETDSPHFEI